MFPEHHPIQAIISLIVSIRPKSKDLIDAVSRALIFGRLVPKLGRNPGKEDRDDPIIGIVLGPDSYRPKVEYDDDDDVGAKVE